MRWLLLALLPACGLYSGPGDASPVPDGDNYELAKIKAIGGEHTVAGVDTDGAGGIWIVYRDAVGDYYTPANVWVTHLDASGAKLSEWFYNDDYTEIGGIAYTGDALWVSYSAVGASNSHLRKLDPATGATIGTFATESGVNDISYGGGQLYLSWAWNEMWTIDPVTGAMGTALTLPFPEGGTERGIAYAGGNVWVALNFTNRLYLVDPSGHVVGSGVSDVLPGTTNPSQTAGLQIAWDGSALIVVVDNQIVWLAAHRI